MAWANLPEAAGQQLPGEVAGAGGWTWGPVLAGKKFTRRQLRFVGIHTQSLSDSVGLTPPAFSLTRDLPKIMLREKQVMGRGAGIERGICDVPGYLIAATFRES